MCPMQRFRVLDSNGVALELVALLDTACNHTTLSTLFQPQTTATTKLDLAESGIPSTLIMKVAGGYQQTVNS